MYYAYRQDIDFGTKVARKNILLRGENVHCFYDKNDSVLFAPRNAILPDFSIKAFSRMYKDKPLDRRLPLADLDTATVRINKQGMLTVRLTLPGPDARVWQYDRSFSQRHEIGTKSVIGIPGGWSLAGMQIPRQTVEFTIAENEFGYSAFSVEHEEWHRQLAFEWQPRNDKVEVEPRIRRRASALALLDGDVGIAREDRVVAAFLQVALIAGAERCIEGYTGKAQTEEEAIDYLAGPGGHEFFEDLLAIKLPLLQISLFDSGKPVLLEYKRECLESVYRHLPVIPGRAVLGITDAYKEILAAIDAAGSASQGVSNSDRIAFTVHQLWRKVAE